MGALQGQAEDVLRDVIPEIEGKLHSWARWVRESSRPGASAGGSWNALREYGVMGPPHRPKGQVSESQQERWVLANQEVLAVDEVVRRTLGKIAQLERQVFWLRYVERRAWVDIATLLHHSETQIKRVFRERLLYAFAMEFGLLSRDDIAN